MTDKSKDKDSETLDSCFSPSVILDACPRRLSPIPDYKRRGQALIGDPIKEWIQAIYEDPGFLLFSFVRRTTLDPRSGSGMTDKSKENDTGFQFRSGSGITDRSTTKQRGNDTGFISTLDPRSLRCRHDGDGEACGNDREGAGMTAAFRFPSSVVAASHAAFLAVTPPSHAAFRLLE